MRTVPPNAELPDNRLPTRNDAAPSTSACVIVIGHVEGDGVVRPATALGVETEGDWPERAWSVDELGHIAHCEMAAVTLANWTSNRDTKEFWTQTEVSRPPGGEGSSAAGGFGCGMWRPC